MSENKGVFLEKQHKYSNLKRYALGKGVPSEN